jgi:segregation and condensation protein A
VLLPSLRDEDAEGDSLEQQLKIYKIYYDVSKNVRKMIAKNQFSFSRQPIKLVEQEFSPPPKLKSNNLAKSLLQLIAELEKTFIKLPKRKMIKIISISERIQHLKKLFESAEKVGFKEFLKSAKNKSEIVVSFLAMLELIKQRHLIAEQDEKDIVIQTT